MKKLVLLIMMFLVIVVSQAKVQKVAILNFENKDRPSGYVAKTMMKRDFKSVFKGNEKLELISLKESKKVYKKSGITNLSYAGSEEIDQMGRNLEADIVVWGDVSSVSNTKFKVVAKIYSMASKDVTASVFDVEKNSKQRKQMLVDKLIPKLEELGEGEIKKIKDIAKQHFNSKNYPAAKESFIQLLEMNDKDIEGYFFLGIISFIEEDFLKSIEYMEGGLEIDPENVDVLNYLSRAYLEIEEFESAVEALVTITEIQEDVKEIWLRIGNIYSDIDEYSEAQAAFEACVELDADYFEAQEALGILLYDQEMYDDAIPSLEKATQLKPNDDSLQKKLAKCYFKTGKLDAAIENYRKVLQGQPENVSAYFNLAGAYRVTNRNDEALSTLIKLKELSPDLPKVYFRLADIYIAMKDYSKAAKSTSKAIELDPALYESYKIMALIKQNLGYKKYEKYLDYVEKYKDKSVYYGEKANELVAKRDKVKKEAYDYFVESENLLDKAKARTKDSGVLKEIENSRKTLRQLKDATKEGAF